MIVRRLTRVLAVFSAAAFLVPVALADQLDVEAKIKNKNPEILDIDLSDDNAGAAGYQVAPQAGGSRDVTVRVTARDQNGQEDLDRLSITVEREDGTVVVASTDATEVASQGAIKEFEATFPMAYYEPPGKYVVVAKVEDLKKAEVEAEANFTYEAMLAFDTDPASVSFSASELEPDTRSAAAELGIRNLGNVAIDVSLSGTDMAAQGFDASIPVGRVKYGLEADLSDEAGLSSSPFTLTGFDLAAGPGSSRDIWFAVDVPSGEEQFIPAATYVGTITIGAEVSS